MSKIFDEIEVSQEVKNFMDHSFAISDQIHSILEKQGKSQRDLARMMGKKESEISKWMTGMHNFTLKSVAKIETALGEKIIITPIEAPVKAEFVKISVHANINRRDAFSSVGFKPAYSWNSSEKTIYQKGIKVA